MEPIRPDWVGQRPLGQRSGRPTGDPSTFANALEPALAEGPGDAGRGPESPDQDRDRDRDRMDHASTTLLAAAESPPQAPRAPKAPPSDDAISDSPSGSADRAPSPPAADPLFGPQPAANRALDGLDLHGTAAPNPISLAENHARGLQSHNPPRPPLPAPQTATPDGPERAWTPLVPDRRQDGPVESRNTFTPLSPVRVAGPPPPPGGVEPPPTAAEPPAHEPVLQPLARRLARLVFTAAAVRGGPPARAGRLRSSLVETPRVEPRQADPAPARAPAELDPALPPEVASAAKPVAGADAPSAAPAAADRPSAAGPREPARLAAPPPRDEPLPPTSLLAHTRVRLDSELSVDLSTSGHKVDIALHGTANAIEPLRTLGAELGTSLASSGFSLGRFLAHDQESDPGQDGEPTETESIERPRTARRLDNSRIRRYA